jgi:hypothetical protein
MANVEIGRQTAPREFWVRCDELLSARGTLLAGYDQLAAATECRARAEAQQLHVRQAAVNRAGTVLNGDLESPIQIPARRATLHTSNLTDELLTDLEQLVADVVERYESEGPLVLVLSCTLGAHGPGSPGV